MAVKNSMQVSVIACTLFLADDMFDTLNHVVEADAGRHQPV
ncbi:hypothetical protein [Herminiimonas fonticola]|nr:hypothetical protein [Herminiimonas fonticola]